ncbi:hypothetical protein CE91St62_01400 [Lachnospiraceae bacterium]|uniref:hypothetical protein n=1 Tax=Extibacter sp. GGCC_0201 TaxID=2731209 RepID=UPI001AA14B73|nr:hypothetical protein [Extibacter sp. GGCC_0201]MBO1720876.1 hypothetical protein [Extibacter sp. GGCC_0201]BDF32066.1 hypothetical protein CE91St61_01410 [Lachnospiraceae bacterium]BDF36079.1 hypothetical protein CE91St62_01400 [Lachnospiraceae bacterium]
MKNEEKNVVLAGDLLQEFEEVQKLVNEEVGVPYATWTKACSQFCTIICCN